MRRLRRLWRHSITNKIAIILLIAFLIIVIGGYTGSWYFSWTGLAEYTKPPGVTDRGKTLWDWLQLLIIPAVLAGGAMWFGRAEREAEREIAGDHLQETALQAYLDRMTDLLLEQKLRKPKKDSEVRAVARARTLTAVHQLDWMRKATIVRFLYEADLINRDKAIIRLEGSNLRGAYLMLADLSEADLSGAYLYRAHLSLAKLSRADLSGADLGGAYLSEADLSGADLSGASLREADFSEVNLREADLSEAKLNIANLSGADLRGASLIGAELRGANLSGADLSGADLSGADLSKITYDDHTIWPDNFTPPPSITPKEQHP